MKHVLKLLGLSALCAVPTASIRPQVSRQSLVTSVRTLDDFRNFSPSGITLDSAFKLSTKSPGYVDVEVFPIMLHFSLITPTEGNTPPDPGIADVAAALKELFRYPNYRLLDDAVMAVDFSGGICRGCRPSVTTSQRITGNGTSYILEATIDSVTSNGVRMLVVLNQELPGPPITISGDGVVQSQVKTLLKTQVTVHFDQTVVIGSTHAVSAGASSPSGGRGGAAGANPNPLQALQQLYAAPGQRDPAMQGTPPTQQGGQAAGGRGGAAQTPPNGQPPVTQGGRGMAALAPGQQQPPVPKSQVQLQIEQARASASAAALPLILVVRPSLRQ